MLPDDGGGGAVAAGRQRRVGAFGDRVRMSTTNTPQPRPVTFAAIVAMPFVLLMILPVTGDRGISCSSSRAASWRRSRRRARR
jgi:hypothetical protein